jgi:hypothetical protein
MTKMVRKQLFITAEQNRRIKSRATATGRSEGEIMRRGIDRELDDKAADAEGDWRVAWRQAFGMWKDRDDLDEFYAERRTRDSQRLERIRKQMRGK